MNFFQHRYYKVPKTLMTLIGQWPYQSTRVRFGFLAVVIFFNTSQIAPLIAAVVKHRDDQTIVRDCFITIIFIACSLTKLILFMWNSQTTLHLVNRIRADWEVWARDREVDILHKYAEQGHKPIIMYTVSTASDAMLIVYVLHGCGIFAALGHKLERIVNNVTSAKTRETQYALDKRSILHIASCIDRHNDALEYVNLIETSYVWIFFVLIGLGMILCNLIGLQIFMKRSDQKAPMTLIGFVFVITILFSIMSYLSQILMDHGDSIRFHIHNSQWYRLSPKAQKLLQFMTMRCNVPCQLTVGKLFVMSMRTFAVTIRTTLSYFMTVRSMQ